MQATYWQSQTDTQLTRWVERLYDRMAADGGACYDIDRPTMRLVHPGLLRAYDAVQSERYRRHVERLAERV